MPLESRPTLPQRIVIVRPSALGDVCRTVPVLASLRAALPQARISWVVQDDFAAAIEAHPALDEVIAFPRKRFGKWWTSPGRAREVRRWFSDLRERRFDVAIDCQGLSRSGLITRATRAKVRIGLRSAREFAWLCYNRRVPEIGVDEAAHTVDRMLSLLSPLKVPAIGDMRLYVPTSASEWFGEWRKSNGLASGAPYAVIAPGSRWVSKRWPIERFADLIEPLLKRGFDRVIVIGSPSEREQVGPLFEKASRHQGIEASSEGVASAPSMPGCLDALMPGRSPVIDLVGATSIAQTMAIVASAGLVIANDSAPLHMAVGFDRPCVALFGPTDPAAVGPYARAECVVRAYQPQSGEPVNYKDDRLGDSLMRLISSAMALQAVDRVLALWPKRAHRMEVETVVRVGGSTAGRSNGSPAAAIQTPRGLEPRPSA